MFFYTSFSLSFCSPPLLLIYPSSSSLFLVLFASFFIPAFDSSSHHHPPPVLFFPSFSFTPSPPFFSCLLFSPSLPLPTSLSPLRISLFTSTHASSFSPCSPFLLLFFLLLCSYSLPPSLLLPPPASLLPALCLEVQWEVKVQLCPPLHAAATTIFSSYLLHTAPRRPQPAPH